MKKILFSALAAIGLLFTPACSDESELLNTGNEELVTFTVNVADGLQTKAIGEGTQAKRLFYEVYEASDNSNQNPVIDKSVQSSTGSWTITMKLVKQKKYNIIFWAQTQDPGTENPYYDVSDLRKIKVNYANAGGSNNDARDAFYHAQSDVTIGLATKTIELKRPFAQLNFMMNETDINAASNRGFNFADQNTKVSVKVTGVATEFHPLTGTTGAASNEAVTFAAAPIPFGGKVASGLSEADNLPIGSTAYYYLATNYLLAAKITEDSEPAVLNEAVLTVASSSNKDIKTTVTNVPVKPNYRTNVYGDFLTANGSFTVTINPAFDDNNGNGTPDDITTAIANDQRVFDLTVTDENNTIYVPKVFDDGNSETLTFNVTNSTTSGAKIVYKGTVRATGGTSAPDKVIIKSSGNWNITLPDSRVTLFGTGGGDGKTMGSVTVTGDGSEILLPVGYIFGTVTMSSGKIWNYAGANVNSGSSSSINIIDGSYFVGANGYLSGQGLRVQVVTATIAQAIAGEYRHWTLTKNITEDGNTLDDYYYIDLNSHSITGTLKLTGSNQITFKNGTVTIDKSEFNGELKIVGDVTVTDENGDSVTGN